MVGGGGGAAGCIEERGNGDHVEVGVKRCGGGRPVVCDGGLTPIEVIIGVTLLAVLSGVVVFQAFRFIVKADDSAASRSLEAAVTVVGIMGQLGSSGGGNLVGDPNPSTETAITKLGEQLSGAALTTFKLVDGGMRFRDDLPGDAQSLWVNVPKNSTLAKPYMTYGLALGRSNPHVGAISNPNLGSFYHPNPTPQPERQGDEPRLYLVDPLKYPEFVDGNVYGFRVQSGNLVRLGVKSVSGATFCAILVRDGAVVAANSKSDVTGYVTTDKSQLIPINGIGYQTVNAEVTSKNPQTLGTLKAGADCGAFWLYHPSKGSSNLGRYEENDHWYKGFVVELPGLPGTDTRLMPPGPDSYGCTC